MQEASLRVPAGVSLYNRTFLKSRGNHFYKSKAKTILRNICSVINELGVSFDKISKVLYISKEDLVLVQEDSDELEGKNIGRPSRIRTMPEAVLAKK